MSEKQIQRIRCPKCGGEHDFTIWNRINTELDPDLGPRIRTGELFRTVCPSCGQQIDVVYPCLYHQMADKLMIYYAPGPEGMKEAVAAFEQGTEDTRNRQGYDAQEEGYTCRVVGSIYDLQEKLAIFDAGLDDRVIEVCKVLVGSELQESRHDADFDDLLYYRDPKGNDRLALMKEGIAFASVSLPREIYDEVRSKYSRLITEYGNETVIDMDWVMKSVSKAGGSRDS